jgi:tetratricopeptide (TPR) repeat protein
VGYLGYYFAWLAVSYLIREPRLLLGLLVLWFVRGLLPPPGAIFGALGRAGRLREQVKVNRANITARRDLATIYLSLLRPRRAIPLLQEGLALAPEDAELMYLHGLALHRAGRHDEALVQLLAAIERDGRLRHGHPYFVAGEALLALKRWDDAADAFERFLDFNSSDVAAHTCLARAYAGGGDGVLARKWLRAGLSTWHGLPGAMKRRQFGAYLRGQWARISVLKDVGAMAVALLLLAFVGFGARAGYPLVAKLWQPDPRAQMLEALQKSAALCGTQRTDAFVGAYDAVPEPPDYEAASAQLSKPDEAERRHWQKAMARQYADFRIAPDRIVSGREMVQEFCLTRVIERSADSLHAEAVLRFRQGAAGAQAGAGPDAEGQRDDEQLGEASAMGLFDIRLNRGAEATRFSFAPLGQPLSPTFVTLRRR